MGPNATEFLRRRGSDGVFDFFREMAEELSGIDSNAARKERQEQKEKEKLDRFIFSKSAKVWIVILAVLYIIMAAGSIAALRGSSGTINFGLMVLKYSLMSIDALIVVFALLFGKEKGEIIALAGTFAFVLGLFVSVALL